MNCQRFENVVSELARGQMMAVEQRGEALAHSETCEKCAARLRDEEMLTLGLQSLASEISKSFSFSARGVSNWSGTGGGSFPDRGSWTIPR